MTVGQGLFGTRAEKQSSSRVLSSFILMEDNVLGSHQFMEEVGDVTTLVTEHQRTI